MQKPKFFKTVAMSVACVITVGLGSNTASAVTNATDRTSSSTAVKTEKNESQRAAMERALTMIDRIPNSVLRQGDAATAKWLHDHYDGDTTTYANVLGCAGAMAALLGGTLVPAAKLLKIKKLVAELGGVKEAVQLMWGASFSYEKMQAAGGALAALGAELLGIGAVKSQCFS